MVRSSLAAPSCADRRGHHEPGWPNSRAFVSPKIPKNEKQIDMTTMLHGGLYSFEPRRWLTNGHLQTIVGNYLPRPAFLCPSGLEIVEVDPADGSRVQCLCDWQPEPERTHRLTVLLVHGLEGSSESQYIK